MKDDKLYLIHILECLKRIEQYTFDGKESFFNDTKCQDAVLRNLQTMAESTQRLSSSLKSANPEIEWDGISGFRNVLVHDYFGLNLSRVWNIVEHHLSDFKQKIEIILRQLD